MDSENAKNAVAYFQHSPSGCQWYRIEHPMEALKATGIPLTQIALDQDISTDNLKSVQFYGIYPFSFKKALDFFKESGIRIIYDVDDATDWIDPSNPYYYSVKRDAWTQQEILPYVDHITASTPKMAEYMSKKTDKPITVIPNCFNESEWLDSKPPRDLEKIRIGFAGSPTHIEDLIIVIPAIIELQKKYPITFVLFGFSNMDYLETLQYLRYTLPPQSQPLVDTFESLMKQVSFEWHTNVSTKLYPQTLINLCLDIGLCPLKSTPFNDARSASKAMEYTLSGALSLASDVEPYRNEPTSILVQDSAWKETIEKYIQDPILREFTRQQSLYWLKTNRNIKDQVPTLRSIYMI